MDKKIIQRGSKQLGVSLITWSEAWSVDKILIQNPAFKT